MYFNFTPLHLKGRYCRGDQLELWHGRLLHLEFVQSETSWFLLAYKKWATFWNSPRKLPAKVFIFSSGKNVTFLSGMVFFLSWDQMLKNPNIIRITDFQAKNRNGKRVKRAVRAVHVRWKHGWSQHLLMCSNRIRDRLQSPCKKTRLLTMSGAFTLFFQILQINIISL